MALCHDVEVKIEEVQELPRADQLTFLRGRIVEASLSMEVVLRYLHVQLHGGVNFDAALDTPQQFSQLANGCLAAATSLDRLNDSTRPLVLSSIAQAARLYERRNRIIHDLLQRDLLHEEQWKLSRVSRPRKERESELPEPVPISPDEMIDLVHEFISATWRLRGVLWTLMVGHDGEISPYLSEPLRPNWDGSISAG